MSGTAESAAVWANCGRVLMQLQVAGDGRDSERRLPGGAELPFIVCSHRSYHDAAFYPVRQETEVQPRKYGNPKAAVVVTDSH